MTISDDYRATLQVLHERNPWGTTGGAYAGDTIAKILKNTPEIRTVLDYGCGEGGLKEYVEKLGVTDREWTLYDPGMKRFSGRPEGKFDLVVTTDVLEHVEPDKQDEVLLELIGYSNNFIFNEIACYKTHKQFREGPYKGMDLHINLRVPDVWRDQIEDIARPHGFKRAYSIVSLLEGWKVRYLSILYKR